MTKKMRSKSSFPRRTLIDAVRVTQSIQDYNTGQPYAVLDLSKALEQSPPSCWFRSLITASDQFGLTKWRDNAKNVLLTDRGRSIITPKNTKEKKYRILK